MKKLLSLALCLLLLIGSAFTISCKDDKTVYQPEQEQEQEQTKQEPEREEPVQPSEKEPEVEDNKSKVYGAECLVKLTANITGATGMGIEEETAKGKKYLVKGDKDNNKDKVSFKNETGETIKTEDGGEIKPNESITQEQIKDQINKLYVDKYNDLTYIQYIPEGGVFDEYGDYCNAEGQEYFRISEEFVRSDDEEYLANGLTEFDTMNYFTDDVIKSYVIDNKTGKIYPIKDLIIKNINDGLVFTEDGFVCDAKIQDSNLVLTSYFSNSNIKVTNFFRDKYNNVYIENQTYNNVDKTNKIVFFDKGYYKANNGEVVYFDFKLTEANTPCYETGWIDLTTTKIQKVKDNLEFENLALNDKYDFDDINIADTITGGKRYHRQTSISHIENGFAYFRYTTFYHQGVYFIRTNIVNNEIKMLTVYQNNDAENIFSLDYNTVIKFDNEQGLSGNLYYAIIDFDKNYNKEYVGSSEIIIEDWVLLKENCVLRASYHDINDFDFTIDTATTKQVYKAKLKIEDNVKSIELITLEDIVLQNKVEYVLQPMN